MNNRMTGQIDFHGNALMLRAERQRLLADNIANADTPGFAARDIDFSSALAAATGGGASGRGAVVTTSQQGHLGAAEGGARVDATAVKYRVSQQASIDGNSVDLDRERANFADNSIRYEAALRFINGSVRTLMSAIKGE